MMVRPAQLALSASLLLLAAACSDDPKYIGEQPPAGSGGFNPGGSGTGGGYGYGASSGTGAGGGTGGQAPLTCDDEFKRCEHTFTYADLGEQSVEVRGDWAPDGWDVGAPMQLSGQTWQATVDVPWNIDVQYKLVVDGNWITDPANPDTFDDGAGNVNSLLGGVTCGEDFTCSPPLLGDFDWRDAVLYFVFVDRFFDGDASNNATVPGVPGAANYQGGDWAGVLQKIEEGYFDELGVNALWLSVPMDNTDDSGLGTDGQNYSAYHGYWPSDLNAVESRFGTMADLTAVVDAAHARGIMVIVDYAMNHVHISSPVYADHPDWFWPVWDGGNYCVCGDGCGWDGAAGRRCWFTDYLPDFNFTNSAARQFSVDNAIQWIQDTGIDGFRLDAVKHIEDAWITDLRARVKSDIEPVTEQHFYMVGETFTSDKNTIGYYVNPSTMLDGQFDFPLRAELISAVLTRGSSMQDLDAFLGSNDGFYGAGIMSTFIGNHDVPRSIHFAQDNPVWSNAWDGGKDKAWSGQPGLPGGTSAFERMANAFTVLYTLPGVPLIYYGDEIGLPGAGDPDNRRFMQWSGYSSGQTLIRDHLKTLATVRAAHTALRRGTRTTVWVNSDVLVYKMVDGGDEVFVAVNRGDGSATASGLPGGALTDELTGESLSGPDVSMPPRSSRILTAP